MEENYLFDQKLKSRGIGVINDSVIVENNIIYPNYFNTNCKPVPKDQFLFPEQHLNNGLQYIEEEEYEQNGFYIMM